MSRPFPPLIGNVPNGNLSPEFVEAQKRLYRGFFHKRFIEGLWVMAQGVIYKDFWSEDLLYEQQEKPISLRGGGGYWQRIITVDYGTTNPMVFLEIYDRDSAVEMRQKTDAEHADDLAQFIGPNNDAKVIVDPSATSFKAEMLKRGIWYTVVVYRVDRLTRSMAAFAKIVEQFDKQGISFVSVTQQFNTTTSMGRLTLNALPSFAQFEREVTGQRIRDKIAASKRKGMWMGGVVPLGYDLEDRHLVLKPAEADQVKEIYRTYIKLGCVTKLQEHLQQAGIRSKKRMSRTGRVSGGASYSRGTLYLILHNRIYLGEITDKGPFYPGLRPAIIEQQLWDQVQLNFQSNLQSARKRPRTTEQSLLVGLLYDKQGIRFTPSHAKKSGRRYRYYVSQPVVKNSENKHRSPVRIPASQIEELVVSQFSLSLQSPQRMMDILVDVDGSPPDVTAVTEASRVWSTASSEKVQQLLRSTVKRIVAHTDRIEVQIIRSRFRQTVLGVPDNPISQSSNPDDLITIEAAAQLK
jgi:hypothetical protein